MKLKFFSLLFILLTNFALAKPSEITLLEKPVRVSLIIHKITVDKSDPFWEFETRIDFKNQRVFLKTLDGGGDLDYWLKRFKSGTGWKKGYLFIPESCGGCNAWRGQRERVYKIKNEKLMLIGEVQGNEEEGGKAYGLGYNNGMFLDTYDKFEINSLTSHATAPAITLVLEDKNDLLKVNLEKTWLKNRQKYKENENIIQKRLKNSAQKKLSYPDESEVLHHLLRNGILAKYCSQKTEFEKTVNYSSRLLDHDTYLKAQTIFSKVNPGEGPRVWVN